MGGWFMPGFFMMIVVVVIGILTAIAYPSYRQYAAKAKRNEAKSALLQIATLQERFYLQNGEYTADMTKLGFPVGANFLTDAKSYIVDVTSASALRSMNLPIVLATAVPPRIGPRNSKTATTITA